MHKNENKKIKANDKIKLGKAVTIYPVMLNDTTHTDVWKNNAIENALLRVFAYLLNFSDFQKHIS